MLRDEISRKKKSKKNLKQKSSNKNNEDQIWLKNKVKSNAKGCN
jgi:hypothetical protein